MYNEQGFGPFFLLSTPIQDAKSVIHNITKSINKHKKILLIDLITSVVLHTTLCIYEKTLDSLIKKGILNYFWIIGGYNDDSSYNMKPIGNKIAKRGFLKHNAIELFVIIDKHKAWIPIVVGIISLCIALRKC